MSKKKKIKSRRKGDVIFSKINIQPDVAKVSSEIYLIFYENNIFSLKRGM